MKRKKLAKIGLIFVPIAFFAIVMNILLIVLARRVRKKEMRFVVALAALDLIVPVSTIFIRIAVVMNNGYDFRKKKIACSIIGPIHFILFFGSMTLVTIIALQRYAKIFNNQFPKIIYTSLLIYGFGYILLVIISAYKGEFVLIKSKINCAPITTRNQLSAAVIFMLGFSLVLFLFITLCCYMKLLAFAIKTADAFKANKFASSDSAVKWTIIATRTFVISIIYCLLVIPSGVLLMARGTYYMKDTAVISLYITFSLFTLSLANPCLVVFAHSVIFREFYNLCQEIKNRIRDCFPYSIT